MRERLRDGDYRELLLLRTGLRRFLRLSEQRAREAGLTPAQHQLLLAIRGHDDPAGPTIGDVAGYLLVQHHSAVELIDRAAASGFCVRRPDRSDARVVRLALTEKGAAALETISTLNLQELRRLARYFEPLWSELEGAPGPARP